MEQNLDKWLDAAQNGNLDLIKRMIKDGIDINIQDEYGWTALQLASRKGHLDVVKFLIEYGADLNAQNDDGWTALHLASLNRCLDIVKVLIEAGSDLNIKTCGGSSALYVANDNNYLDVVRVLIEAGAILHQSIIEKYRDQLDREIADNIKRNEGWQWIQYLFPDQQLEFPEHLRVASQMGLYD
jgi:ankyrin repeat protein